MNSALITTIKKLHSGYLNGARVTLGKLEDFIKTACLTSLTFFGTGEHGQENEKNVMSYIDSLNSSSIGLNSGRLLQLNNKNHMATTAGSRKKLGSIIGIAKRSRSIHYSQCPSEF